MRSTTLTRRRTRRALGIAALLPVLALAACNGDDSGGADPTQDPTPTASTGGENGGTGGQDTEGGTGGEEGDGKNSGTPPLSQAQLDQALLTTGDLAGWKVEVEDSSGEEGGLGTEPESCRPIADAVSPAPQRERTAQATAVAHNEDGQVVPFVLAAYTPGEAEEFLGELREAVARCGTFTGTEEGKKPAKLRAKPVTEQVSVGDESVAFDLSSAEKGSEFGRILVVRTGGNTATYLGMDVGAGLTTPDKALVAKQHEKLVAAAGN